MNSIPVPSHRRVEMRQCRFQNHSVRFTECPCMCLTAAPVITRGLPAIMTAFAGDEVNLTCVGHSIPAPDVEWKKNNETLHNVDTQTTGEYQVTSQLKIEHVSLSDGGNYTCSFHNRRGNASSATHLSVYGEYSVFSPTNNFSTFLSN